MEALITLATEHTGQAAAVFIISGIVGWAAWMISGRFTQFDARLKHVETRLDSHSEKDSVIFEKLDELVQKVSRIEGILDHQG